MEYITLPPEAIKVIEQLLDTPANDDGTSLSDLSNSTEMMSITSAEDHKPMYECPCTEASENKQNFFELPCNCLRCKECLCTEIAIGLSRNSWPPQCQECRIDIPFDFVRAQLPTNMIQTWNRVRQEYDDPEPVYCATSDCNIYLSKSTYTEDNKWAKCSKCSTKTCTTCASLRSWHSDDGKCPDIFDPESLAEMKKRGYKPCPWCKMMIERDHGCDHMHCERCGRNFCYNCGQKKGRQELPCNCNGQHAWVDDDMRDMDPEVQQDILDRIQNGMNLPAGFNNIHDLELLPEGRFRGLGRRVGEDGDEPANADPVEGALQLDVQLRAGAQREFDRFLAIDDEFDLMARRRFNGQGHRLGDEADVDAGQIHQDFDDDLEDRRAPLDQQQQPRYINFRHFQGQGRRLDDPVDDVVEEEQADDEDDAVSNADINQDDEYHSRDDPYTFGLYGQGRRLAEAPEELDAINDADDQRATQNWLARHTQDAMPRLRRNNLVRLGQQATIYGNNDHHMPTGYHFQGHGRTIADPGEAANNTERINEQEQGDHHDQERIEAPTVDDFIRRRYQRIPPPNPRDNFGRRHFRGQGQNLVIDLT